MNAKDKFNFNQLLKKVATKEKGWIPEECRNSFYKLIVTPFIELAIIRRTKQGNEYFLIYREDDDFTGWHLPGGMVKTNYSENLAGMCKSIIDRELPGTRITNEARVVKILKWKKHPWANPLAILCLCKAKNIQETKKAKFFPALRLPKPMASKYHAGYIRDCEEFLKP